MPGEARRAGWRRSSRPDLGIPPAGDGAREILRLEPHEGWAEVLAASFQNRPMGIKKRSPPWSTALQMLNYQSRTKSSPH